MRGVNEDTPTPARMTPCLAGLRTPRCLGHCSRGLGSDRAAGPAGGEVVKCRPLSTSASLPALWGHTGASGRLPGGSRCHFLSPEPDPDRQAGVRVILESVQPPGPRASPWGSPGPGRRHGGPGAGGCCGALGPPGGRGAQALLPPSAPGSRAGHHQMCWKRGLGGGPRPAGLCRSLKGPQASAPVASGKFVRTQQPPACEPQQRAQEWGVPYQPPHSGAREV